jgi:hypothetical protein
LNVRYLDELAAMGYRKTQKILSPAQYRFLVDREGDCRRINIFFTISKKSFTFVKKPFNIMAATTTKKTVKRTTAKATLKAEKPKKLSKLGQWMREHPHGLGDVIIYDKSILYN